VVVLLSELSTARVVEAMRAGAKNVLDRSMDARLVAQSVQATCEAEQSRLDASTAQRYFHPEHCGAMHDLQASIHRIGKTDSTALIVGETGTGKELVALQLHAASARCDQNMITVNCAAIPETLIESELFGYEKGAFTGATSNRMGLIEAAHNSTLFLDEIGELPLAAQARLLRFIQEGEIRRIGAIKSTKVNIRLICATHRPLDELAHSNLFRPDLYYRINVLRLDIPPLRERGHDIAAMAKWFVTQLADKLNMPPRELSKDSLALIAHHTWPGNVRELQNAVERALIMSDDSLLALDLPVGIQSSENTITPDRAPEKRIDDSADELSLEDYFQRFVLQHQDAMNETELAQKLGISRKSLWERRQRFGMPRTKPKAGD
jgi:DNA-binding NtrC family response regulator